MTSGSSVRLANKSNNCYDRVAETVRVDFKEELEFLDVYDQALTAINQIIDMPDRKASLLAMVLLQNGGTMSKKKRDQFAEVIEAEITAIESAIVDLIHFQTKEIDSE
jgi:hypothetical protein